MRRVLSSFVAAALLGGCAGSQVAYMTPDEIRTASNKIETPARISTVQFKELGDTKRGEVIQRIIRDIWGESCKPFTIIPEGYFPNGTSRWSVRCAGSVLIKDYAVDLPERADGNARALKCFKSSIARVTCDIIGHPPGQGPDQPAGGTAAR
jgi:hypothetical protein